MRTPTHRISTIIVVALSTVVSVLALAGTSIAFTTHALTGSFGLAGPGTGEFSNVQAVTVDQSTGDVYVYDAGGEGSVYKFDSSGDPLGFTERASNVIEKVGVGCCSAVVQLAVDNSSAATKGDLYVDNYSEVLVFDSKTGKQLGAINGAAGGPWGKPCGVAVDGNGHVYVGLENGDVNKYTPAGNPATNTDYTSSLWSLGYESCNLAADGSEGVLVNKWERGPITKYEASQFKTVEEPAGEGTLVDTGGGTLAIDPSTGDVYVDEQGRVTEYDSSTVKLGSFGNVNAEPIAESYGVAATGKTGEETVYASDKSRGRVDIFGPAILLPSVTACSATNVQAVDAVLCGSIEPAGSGTHYYFEYDTSEYLTGRPAHGTSTPSRAAASTGQVEEAVSDLQPNKLYHYRLAGENSSGTYYSEQQSFTTSAVLPTVDDAPPSVLSAARTSVTVQGTVNPENSPTTYRLEYGLDENYGLSTGTGGVGSGFGDTSVGPIVINELLPNTTYHYRLVTTNQAGTITGTDHTFTTSSLTPPLATTEDASEVAQTTVILAGSVGTQGLQTFYGFEIGTVAGEYGPGIVVGSEGGVGVHAASLRLNGLSPGTTYHYRVYATNSDGTTHGADLTFTTASVPNQLAQPSTSPLLAIPTIAFPKEEPAKKTTTKPKKKIKKKTKSKDKTKGKGRGKGKNKSKKKG